MTFLGYELPILSGEKFIGRLEAVKDTKNSTLKVKNLWLEDEKADG